jgi:hypothetical protein
MLNSAFDLGEEIELRTLGYRIHQGLWSKYDLSAIDLRFENWSKIKYLTDDGSEFHPDIELVPNDAGGIYLFYIPCPIIKGLTDYPFYIGRAQFTEHQNLRKRCREYFNHYRNNEERGKITRMMRYWGKELHLAFKVIDDNPDIRDYEKRLINSLLLPMNDQIPDTEIRQAIQAFQ